MLVALGVYAERLEPALVRESHAYFRDEGERLIEACDAPRFLAHVDSRLAAAHEARFSPRDI